MLLAPFLQQCHSQPDASALEAQEHRLSYRQLLQRAGSIAAALQARGVKPGQAVTIHLDRGIEATLAVFGVLLAGACYVPLDLKNPPARLRFIIKDAQSAAVLGMGEPPAWLDHAGWLNLEACPPAEPSGVTINPEAIAAILYTSGSTGQPRGVALSHGAIATFAQWAADQVDLQPEDRIANSTPFFFDLSTFDLYAVLGRGASLHFLPPALPLAPARLSAWLAERAISGWYTVPSLLAFLAYKGNLAQTPLPALRFLLFAGEVFPSPALLSLCHSLPKTRLYNFFGPTETNVCCSWPVDVKRLRREQTIPIGLPASGCELTIEAVSGELWVRGPSVASGYWQQGQLQPFLNDQGWYATGDKVSFEQGEYRFHGRLGRMLKCSGYRVEPAEIEAIVNALPTVKECAIIGVDDPTAGQRPALALALTEDGALSEVRKALLQQLPAYMQPCQYQVLSTLPRLANGKLDYQSLTRLFTA